MFSIEKQVDIVGGRQVFARAEHSARMTLAEKGGRAIMRVLSKEARVVSVSAVATGVDVEASGKLVVSAVCETHGGEIVCLEYVGNFNFTHKAVGVSVPASCDVSAIVSQVRVLRASGCEVAVEVELEILENFSVAVGEPSVVSAVDCYSSVRCIPAVSSMLKVHDFVCSGEMEVDGAIETVLSQQFYCEHTGVSYRGDSVVCSGNIHGWLCYKNIAGEIKRESCSFPYREEFSCAEAEDYAVFARAGECSVVCEVNEIKGVSAVTFDVEVEISLWGYQTLQFECGSDFFCDKFQLISEQSEFVCSQFVGAVQGTAKFSEICDWPYDLSGDVLVASARVASVERVESTAKFGGNLVCCVCSGGKFCELQVPYAVDFPINPDGGNGVCDVCVAEISARISAGKVEVFGRVCGNLVVTKERREIVVSSLSIGNPKENVAGGFVLYRAEKGETLLGVCESVGVMPELLKSQNPNVLFPIPAETKVVVWKQA
ncbi:MAG: hypothetical protein R3Y32_08840 [Bacillota bacterium]